MRSDKMQMSYVPQVTEHVAYEADGTKWAGTDYTDIRIPLECVVEQVVVVVKEAFDQVLQLHVGSTANQQLFTPAPVAVDSTAVTDNTIIDPQVLWISVDDIPGRVVRLEFHNPGGLAPTQGKAYVYLRYRFNPQMTTPTKVTV